MARAHANCGALLTRLGRLIRIYARFVQPNQVSGIPRYLSDKVLSVEVRCTQVRFGFEYLTEELCVLSLLLCQVSIRTLYCSND